MADSAFVLSNLPDYIKENRDELFIKSTLGAKSLDYIDVMPNVKWKEALNYLDSTIEFQDGSNCGWNPSGTDTVSQRFVETAAIKVEKAWCYKDWEKKFANYQLMWQAGREKLPFEEKVTESNMNLIQEAIEDLVWKGNSALTVTGLIADAKAESATTVEFESGQTVSDKINAIVAALPVRMLKKGVNIFISYTDFRNYIMEQNGACCQNKPVLDAGSESVNYFGDSRIKIVPVLGLEDTGIMMAATPDTLVYATDVENAENVYRLWFDEKEEMFDFRVLFRAGTAIRYIDEVVIGE